MKVLVVTSSARYAKSRSRQAADKLIKSLKSVSPEPLEITERDLSESPPSHLDEMYVKAIYNKKLEKQPEKFPEEVKRIQESKDLCNELMDTDILIVATAMYNFNVPANLKLWIDHVVRSWTTFHYGNDSKWHGHLGHITGHIIMSSGSLPPGGYINGKLYDHCSVYLQQIFDFIGIRDTGVTGFCNTMEVKVEDADYDSIARKLLEDRNIKNLDPDANSMDSGVVL